jgi:hypothetical protein
MALEKNIEADSGASVSYWRITRVDFNLIDNTVWYALTGYVSKETRDAGKYGVRDQSFTMPLETTPEEITRAVLYTDAKGRDEFTNAQDV